MPLSIPEIRGLFEAKGGRMYDGEPVTVLEHSLQTAALAEREGASPALVAASLLHDLGHLLNDKGENPTARGVDDLHQYFALPFLRGSFPDEVLEPIRLHVDAKRFLCRDRPAYYDNLSLDSKRSLELQGGIYSPDDAGRFATQPFAADAVKLRIWDDLAKVEGGATPDLAHFEAVLRRVAP
jgi:phosphonate degradation associated HDIG domain protein